MIMEKIIDYIIVGGSTSDELYKTVRSQISRGWQPLGNIVLDSSSATKYKFLQTMVKYQA